jgi:hypothetical protein
MRAGSQHRDGVRARLLENRSAATGRLSLDLGPVEPDLFHRWHVCAHSSSQADTAALALRAWSRPSRWLANWRSSGRTCDSIDSIIVDAREMRAAVATRGCGDHAQRAGTPFRGDTRLGGSGHRGRARTRRVIARRGLVELLAPMALIDDP